MYYIVDNTTDKNHYSVIENLASIADEMIIASPYCFSDFSHFFGKITTRGSIKTLTFVTTLKGEEITAKINSVLSFRQMAIKHGIKTDILINDALHGKVYIFKSNGVPINAIVTSANATHNGLRNNHEWGCCFDDKDQIESLEKTIMSTVKSQLKDDIINKVKQRVDEHQKKYLVVKQTPLPVVNIGDIIVSDRFDLDIDSNTRIFLKPIGYTASPVFDGDYSNETKQYFAVHPVAVRKNDLLVSYGVGSRKIISIFRVVSDTALNTGDEDSRWPWYVQVENLSPKFAKVWFEKDLYIINLARDYVGLHDLPITNKGGKTLGALQWGVDKIWLAHDFGTELLSLVMAVEKIL